MKDGRKLEIDEKLKGRWGERETGRKEGERKVERGRQRKEEDQEERDFERAKKEAISIWDKRGRDKGKA